MNREEGKHFQDKTDQEKAVENNMNILRGAQDRFCYIFFSGDSTMHH